MPEVEMIGGLFIVVKLGDQYTGFCCTILYDSEHVLYFPQLKSVKFASSTASHRQSSKKARPSPVQGYYPQIQGLSVCVREPNPA